MLTDGTSAVLVPSSAELRGKAFVWTKDAPYDKSMGAVEKPVALDMFCVVPTTAVLVLSKFSEVLVIDDDIVVMPRAKPFVLRS